MDDARRVLELRRKMHALAASPDRALLTLVELECLAEKELASLVIAGVARATERHADGTMHNADLHSIGRDACDPERTVLVHARAGRG